MLLATGAAWLGWRRLGGRASLCIILLTLAGFTIFQGYYPWAGSAAMLFGATDAIPYFFPSEVVIRGFSVLSATLVPWMLLQAAITAGLARRAQVSVNVVECFRSSGLAVTAGLLLAYSIIAIPALLYDHHAAQETIRYEQHAGPSMAAAFNMRWPGLPR